MAFKITWPHRSGRLASSELSRPASCRYWFPREEIVMAVDRPVRSLVSSMSLRYSASRALTSSTKSESTLDSAVASECSVFGSPPAKPSGPGTIESYLALANLIVWASASTPLAGTAQLTRFTKLPRLASNSLLLAEMKDDHMNDESLFSGRCERR